MNAWHTTGKIKQEFLDIDATNIHIRWEPFIQTIDDTGILKKYGFKTEYLVDLQREEQKYLKEKKQRLQIRDLDSPVLDVLDEEEYGDELPESDDESSIGGNPLLALKAASFLKSAPAILNVLKKHPKAVQMSKQVLQNPQNQQQVLEMFQQEDDEIEEI